MQGDKELIKKMNVLLTAELTAIDFYFVHSRVLEDMGYNQLYEQFLHEMTDEQGHATKIIQRMIFLNGTPEVGQRLPFNVTKDVVKIFEDDLKAEHHVRELLIDCIDHCMKIKDFVSMEVLEPLLADTEEDHIDWLETQLELIKEIGLQNYLAEKI
ncbi:MAG: bacterioferritin [Zetaproteobacteria bacterium]|nr:bacterioferritin [Pseudobdellovibrionaceae bacterium]|tara:strand:+ start:338 stop:805 length:468 start_codon:yes stop_codon:yes gene_type:complete